MNILLTGANGFIGSHLTRKLIKDHQLTILTRPSSDLTRIKPFLSELTNFELGSDQELDSLFSDSKFELIIHLATYYTKAHSQLSQMEKMIESNLTFPSKLLELAIKHQVEGFINTGTCFEYQLATHPIDENQTIQPYNFYALTKNQFEQALQFYHHQHRLKTLSLRLFYPYGPNDNRKLVTILLESLQTNQPIHISLGTQQLDYVYVTDIVDAYLKSIQFISSDRYQNHQVFNIGEGKPKTVKQVAQTLNKLHGQELIFCDKPIPEQEIKYMVADISKAQQLLKWTPQYNLQKGLSESYHDYLKTHS